MIIIINMKTKYLISILLIVFFTSCRRSQSFKDKSLPIVTKLEPDVILTKDQESKKKNLISLLLKDKVFERYVMINDKMAALFFNRNKNITFNKDINIDIQDKSLK